MCNAEVPKNHRHSFLLSIMYTNKYFHNTLIELYNPDSSEMIPSEIKYKNID